MPYSREELDFLLSNDQAVTYAADLELSAASELKDLTALQKLFGQHARSLVELTRSRRVASRKIDSAAQWLVDSPSAQQATPSPVARFRSKNLEDLGVEWVADVTCSIGTELAHLHQAGIHAVGADLDESRVRMASHNVPECAVVRADALRPVVDAPVVIADPARRGSSGRIHRITDLMPPLPELIAAHKGRELAVKCAPGIDFTVLSQWAGQVDVVSVDGEVKEACVYTPGLQAEPSGQLVRRAVVLRGKTCLVLSSTLPYESDDAAAAGPAGRYIFDPDGAIVRAGLVRHLAHRHGWWQLDPRIAYLTGESLPGDGNSEDIRAAGVRAFRVEEAVPLKKLKAALTARKAVRLEILVRGVDVDPDQLRKKLKLKGDKGGKKEGTGWSVVITRIEDSAMAFICTAL